jgi:hypothetical protein
MHQKNIPQETKIQEKREKKTYKCGAKTDCSHGRYKNTSDHDYYTFTVKLQHPLVHMYIHVTECT